MCCKPDGPLQPQKAAITSLLFINNFVSIWYSFFDIIFFQINIFCLCTRYENIYGLCLHKNIMHISYLSRSVCLYSHNSSPGGRRQKTIGALNSAEIGEGAKLQKIQKFFLTNWWGLERAKKWWKYEHKSSLGGRGQKLIGALNSTKIGEDAKPKKFQNFFLKNWWGLERAQKWWKYEHKSSLGGCGQKLTGALNSPRIGEDGKPTKKIQKFVLKNWRGLERAEKW